MFLISPNRYITVGNQPNKRHLYYYFTTSERKPSKDAVLLWVNGGPGCSGLDAMIIDDLAPRRPVKLLSNPFSWTKVASIIYVDSPAGTGYSYADSVDDYITNDTKTVADLYEFILKFFSEYPEFLPNPLYVGACSYSGVVVPLLAQEMVNGIEAGKEPNLNFKGYSMGNAAIDIDIENNGKIPFAHRLGLISDEIYEDLTRSCKGDYWRNSDPDCLKNLQVFQENIQGINREHVLCLPCQFELGFCLKPNCYESDHMEYSLHQNSEHGSHHCHIEVSGEWTRCANPRLQYERDHFNLIPYHLNLTMKDYRAFIYCGDHDMVVPYTATAEWIKSLNYSIIEGWRPWFVDGLIAGYNVRYDHNLLFATFKGAGHTVPEYVPHQALIAYQRWIDGAGSL
ncbi:putative carboxypeptidase C [Dioscorea sansibarensis]